MTVLATITLFLLIGPSLFYCQPNFSGPTCNRLPFPSDGNLLTLQWPISFCYKQGRCSLQRPRHDFVIHGLWPQFNASKSELAREISGTSYPQYCCHPQERDVDLAQLPGRLGEEMSAVWPSLKQPRRSPQAETFSFWRHEWSKHGKCYSVDLPHRERRFFTAEAYFSAVLQLYKQFPIIRWLASAQIVPSNRRPYSREQIHRALSTKESLRGVFRLKCDRPSRQNEAPPQAPALLSEVQVCLDQSLKPVHCGHLFGGRTGKYERSQLETFETFDDHQCGNEVMLLES